MGDARRTGSFDGSLVLFRRSRFWLGAFVAIAIVELVRVADLVWPGHVFAGKPGLTAMIALCTLPFWLMWRRGQLPTRSPRARAVRIDESGIRVDDRHVASLAEVASARTESAGRSGAQRLRLYGRNGAIVLDAEVDDETVPELLRLLGHDTASRCMTFWGSSAGMRTPARATLTHVLVAVALMLVMRLGVTREAWGQLHLELVVVAAAIVATLGLRERIVVGADGVEVVTRLGQQRRFVRYAEMDRVVDLATSEYALFAPVRVFTLDGRHVDLHPMQGEHAALVARLVEGMTHSRTAASAPGVIARTRFAETDAWLDSLRSLARARDTYRTNEVDLDDVGSVLRDPTQPPTDRAAAAYVLSLRAPDQSEPKVRAAAEAVADDDLREALDDIAGGVPQDGERALRRLLEREL